MTSYDYEDMYQALVQEKDAEKTQINEDEMPKPLVQETDVLDVAEMKTCRKTRCKKIVLFLIPIFTYLLFGVILPHGGGGGIHRAILIDGFRPLYDIRMMAALLGSKYVRWLGHAQVALVNTSQCHEEHCDYQGKLDAGVVLDEVQYWGIGGRSYFHGSSRSSLQFLNLLQDTGTLPAKGGVIWLKTSAISNHFARDLALRSGCFVVCYSNNVFFFQGRAKGFAPNGTMTSPDDGIDTNLSHLSMPWDPRTDVVSQMRLRNGVIPNQY